MDETNLAAAFVEEKKIKMAYIMHSRKDRRLEK